MAVRKLVNANICSWNANGILRNKLELEAFTQDLDIAVICVQETHLHPSDRFRMKDAKTRLAEEEGAES